MALNIVPIDTCMYAFDIEDMDDYNDKSTDNSKMMYRHIDSTHVENEVLVEAKFGWLNDCTYSNDFEKQIFFYHKDHLGSSTQISDRNASIIHHPDKFVSKSFNKTLETTNSELYWMPFRSQYSHNFRLPRPIIDN